eukprot:CAMPEP_0202482554 /NCGR_PEP_ID=MMETSP1361-20130828/1956_1 /ASSEMBLY_ACC=CAM_ASM_000849 /TAXON_ID=210615 /ORGANISM="Staurosira complex sp., Strain CCMP2646" /LENGTH=564 /DNA_ID=CAMNT_0049110493 /DNA_START=48 /DNA_END=1740 /DNA_ORIENTATION=-
MASYRLSGSDHGSHRSKRKVHDESAPSILSDDSSEVSSITRQTMDPAPETAPVMEHPQKSDVEGGVPFESPLENTSSTKTQYPSERSSLRERLTPFGLRCKSFCEITWLRCKSFCENNRRLVITTGVGTIFVVIVVVISVTVSGRNTNQEAATVAPRRDQELVNIMSTISSSQSLSDPTSPQYMAKQWLIEEDPLQLTPSDFVSEGRILQRYALAVFYFATGGPESWDPNSWLQGQECAGQYWIGLSCNDNDEVRAMAFDDFGLSGFIPPEIGALTMLENLILKNHEKLTGQIPVTIGQLSILGQLGLYNNALTGGIPHEMYGATRLNYINFQNNQLDGGLSIGIEKMTNLEKLILFNNYFSGGLPFQQFANTKMTFLGVSNNGFSSTIPSIISRMSRLEYFYIDGNEFSGLVPENLGKIPSLKSLNLNDNKFTGTIPSTFGNLRSVDFLSLQNNQLKEGTLEGLYLSDNKLVGNIPSALCSLTELRALFLDTNDLTGELPACLDSLTHLRQLYVFNNELTGILPEGLQDLTSLRGLGIEGNTFVGEVSPSICKLRDDSLSDFW